MRQFGLFSLLKSIKFKKLQRGGLMEWLKDYLQKISDKRENKRLIIYGAGRVANIILSLSMDHGIPIEGFCVTNLEENVKSIKGFPVWQFDQLSYDPKEALILIGEHIKLKWLLNRRAIIII